MTGILYFEIQGFSKDFLAVGGLDFSKVTDFLRIYSKTAQIFDETTDCLGLWALQVSGSAKALEYGVELFFTEIRMPPALAFEFANDL